MTASVLTLKIAKQSFSSWTSASIDRDLQNMAGGFDLKYVDELRAARAVSLSGMALTPSSIDAGSPCVISIDDEVVLDGYIDDLDLEWSGETISAQVLGRDRTGDLVDCAAAPYGPAEFKGVDLLAIAATICKPFGIPVRAETSVGAPFERLAVAPHENALPLLEKAARQRAVLLVADGTGGLLLTTGGSSRGPAALIVGQNAQATHTRFSWRRRFSDVFVKGQTDSRARRTGRAPAMDHTAVPLTADPLPPAPAAASADEASTVLMTGHAVDPEITRWRPTVRMTRTQSGMSTTQEQAEWAVRVARGMGDTLTYTVLGWRAGPANALWRPNQVVPVYDPYAGIDQDMLIAGVKYIIGPEGQKTQLRVTGRTAFDRINESERRRPRHPKAPASTAALYTTATPL
jgi:prophage tail gpP-like protein